MLYFPQLQTGAIAQYPLRRRRVGRTALNAVPGGEEVKLWDADDERLEWELHLKGLTDEEWRAVEELFHACEGSLGSFCFLDPTANLLRWSSDPTQTVWRRDAVLEAHSGLQDPFGGNGAVRLVNPGQTEQTLSQALDVPASFQYCFSLFVRGAAQGRVKLKQWSSSRTTATEFEVTSSWRRISQTARLGGTEARVNFGVAIPAGGSVEIYGPQVEPHPGASDYKESREQGGIYPSARFVSDELRVRTDGVDSHASVIRIAASLKQS
jgi:hypothetical protein